MSNQQPTMPFFPFARPQAAQRPAAPVQKPQPIVPPVKPPVVTAPTTVAPVKTSVASAYTEPDNYHEPEIVDEFARNYETAPGENDETLEIASASVTKEPESEVVPEKTISDVPADPSVPSADKPDTTANKPDDVSEAEKKRKHEEAEAKRKAEFDAKQKVKKEADAKALAAWEAMTDAEAGAQSSQKVDADTERLTRRNMKICVTDCIKEKCMNNAAFARMVGHPRKSMINCFKYINRMAREFLEQEMKDNDEKAVGGSFGGDVPDDLCYKWAEDYFSDPNAKEDESQEEKFVPKPYYGGSSAKSKSKKKEPAKSEPKKKPETPVQEEKQVSLWDKVA